MPKSDEQDEETCLKTLIKALEASKEEARKKLEEAVMLKAKKGDKENGMITEGHCQYEQFNRAYSPQNVKSKQRSPKLIPKLVLGDDPPFSAALLHPTVRD
ncbi:hypothetical protein POTOM_016603 [Populus tomentosa]|nr:hypothetical protein POTOM_016603 [Populus tomentosa]